MEERRSDTEETFGSEEQPGATSDQNAEEAGGPHEADSGVARGSSGSGEDEGDGGGAGEDSQATGHPENAG